MAHWYLIVVLIAAVALAGFGFLYAQRVTPPPVSPQISSPALPSSAPAQASSASLVATPVSATTSLAFVQLPSIADLKVGDRMGTFIVKKIHRYAN
jgi:hypothetical protein